MLINHDFPPEIPPLTERQAQVLACLGDHMTTKEIARTLAISPSMVDQHLRVISLKMGGLSRRKLARLHAAQLLRTSSAPAAPLSEPDLPMPQPTAQPQPSLPFRPDGQWSFMSGFLFGFVCGMLVVLVTTVVVTFLLGAR